MLPHSCYLLRRVATPPFGRIRFREIRAGPHPGGRKAGFSLYLCFLFLTKIRIDPTPVTKTARDNMSSLTDIGWWRSATRCRPGGVLCPRRAVRSRNARRTSASQADANRAFYAFLPVCAVSKLQISDIWVSNESHYPPQRLGKQAAGTDAVAA